MLMLLVCSILCGFVARTTAHDRPIIGILTQELSKVFELMYPGQYDSFIAASYVKWVEQGGARVVPIWIGQEPEYYRSIMSKINGVLLPGGSVDMFQKGGYIEAAEEIMDIATEFNNQKDIFPVFGVGLGMDIMLDKSTEAQDISRECQLDLMAVSLILSKKDTKRTAFYNSSSEHIKRIISSHPVAVLNAKKCYPKDVFEMSNLANLWIPFSYNLDRNGKMIVSSIEHDHLPFYGTLFHGEKTAFEWAENNNFPHTLATVEVAQFFSNYFVNEARKSSHTFDNKKQALDHLIENFTPVFTAKDGSNYFQTYLFNKDRDHM